MATPTEEVSVEEIKEGDDQIGDQKKKFPWKKLSEDDLIYTKVGKEGHGDLGPNGHLEMSKGRWKKSALLERKPKDDPEGKLFLLMSTKYKISILKELPIIALTFFGRDIISPYVK